MSAVLASILGIGFWTIAALAIVTLMAYVYVQIQYYRWDKTDREFAKLESKLVEKIAKTGLTENTGNGKIAESAAPTLEKGSNLSDGTGEIPCGGSEDIC